MVQNFFPQLKERIYFDNAGGTQVPTQVMKRMGEFLEDRYVQPNGYNVQSMLNTNMVNDAKNFVSTVINNIDGNIILGPSATQIAFNVSKSLNFEENDEIILSTFSHESATSSFERIPNVNIKYWNIDNDLICNGDKLLNLINNKTKLIVLPHVSNVLGNIVDIKTLILKIKLINKNVMVYVDGVAYLPHDIIDVEDLNVDFYVVSFYKFLGTRISALYIKKNVLETMDNLNHYFLDGEKKLEIGGIQYEQCVSLLGIKDYLCDVVDEKVFTRDVLKKNFEIIRQKEVELIQYFDERFNLIKNDTNLKMLTNIHEDRVPIFSLYGENIDNLCFFLNKVGIECKTGTFYCDRLLKSLNIEKVLRVSLVHYNNGWELDMFFFLLKECKSYTRTNVNCVAYNYKLSENVKNSFNHLEIDNYYNNKRYRAFSMIDIKDFLVVGESYFLQSKAYNDYLGDELRIYKNIDDSVINDVSFRSIITKFINTISGPKEYRYLYVHQIRVDCEDYEINPVPEGIHRDGYEYICITCVNKVNIDGPITEIYDSFKNLINETVMEPGDNIILNDNKYFHNVKPLKKITQHEKAYRDIFVLTTVL